MLKHNRSPKDIDVYAGEQLKKRRKELGMSQKALAESVGVTFQQIQKYEKGLNRIGASRLYDFCKVLKVKLSYFFKDIAYDSVTNSSHQLSEDENTTDIMDLILLFKQIKDDNKKKIILDLVRSLSEMTY